MKTFQLFLVLGLTLLMSTEASIPSLKFVEKEEVLYFRCGCCSYCLPGATCGPNGNCIYNDKPSMKSCPTNFFLCGSVCCPHGTYCAARFCLDCYKCLDLDVATEQSPDESDFSLKEVESCIPCGNDCCTDGAYCNKYEQCCLAGQCI